MEIGKMVLKTEEIPHRDLREFVEDLVAQATAIGLLFTAYGYSHLEHDAGVHIFVYLLPEDGVERANKVEELFTRGDDGQPHATYTRFIDEIWHFIPYYC